MIARLRQFAQDIAGTTAIETAIVAPILMTLSLGAFEISSVVARQSELQSAAEQVTEISLASRPDTAEEALQIERILVESTGLEDTAIDVDLRYRCAAAEDLTTSPGTCDEDELSTFVRIEMRDSYTPIWTEYGIGDAFAFLVERTVQVS